MKSQLILLILCVLWPSKMPDEMISLNPTTSTTAMIYLAMGDSYTIGESVSQMDSFPYQLVSRLNSKVRRFPSDPKIIARTGWTTSELQEAIKLHHSLSSSYTIVTLLIGVNNQYRGNALTAYRREFKALLQTAIEFAGGNKSHVFVLSIPDWGATPFGQSSGRGEKTIAKEIDEFNAVNKEETMARNICYIDITPTSRNATRNTALIASDGLHPSGKMYEEWVNALEPKILDVLP